VIFRWNGSGRISKARSIAKWSRRPAPRLDLVLDGAAGSVPRQQRRVERRYGHRLNVPSLGWEPPSELCVHGDDFVLQVIQTQYAVAIDGQNGPEAFQRPLNHVPDEIQLWPGRIWESFLESCESCMHYGKKRHFCFYNYCNLFYSYISLSNQKIKFIVKI
jgi:hypothetical protein